MSDTVRVLRVIEYVGPRAAVEKQIERSITGTKTCHVRSSGTGGGELLGEVRISVATIGAYPEVLLALRPEEEIPFSLLELLADARRHVTDALIAKRIDAVIRESNSDV